MPAKPHRVTEVDPSLAAHAEALGPALRRHFVRRGVRADADDLVQTVFLRLHASTDFSTVDNAERYIFRVANNVLVDYARKQGAIAELDRAFYSLEPQATDLSPERHLIGRDDLESFLMLLDELPPKARAAFVMHRFEELSYFEIARRMNISVSGVEKLLSRALKRLGDDWQGA